MAVSATDIATLRRRTNEPDESTYTDEELAVAIEAFPLIDADEYEPDDASWTPTYDVAAAASRIWAEKAGKLTGDYDFSADGGTFNRSQAYEMAMKQSRYWEARRAPRSLRAVIAHEFEETFQAAPESDNTVPYDSAVNGPEEEDYE